MDILQPQENYRLITTADGSRSLLHPVLNTAFHSTHGALQESKHVFIQHGLNDVASRFNSDLRICEVGFGTGLNALLSAQWSEQNKRALHYHSIEKYPLHSYWHTQLAYTQHFPERFAAVVSQIQRCDWGQDQTISPFFTIHKQQADLVHTPLPEHLHLVYYDAFAPGHSPEMWEESIFRKFYEALLPGGALVTFCAKGALKRLWRQCGFEVQSLAGPPGKREMTRLIRPH